MGRPGGAGLLVVPLIWQLFCGLALPACREPLEFRCCDSVCIPRPRVCDGHTDCQDGSDEEHCYPVPCKKDEFACRSRRCISLHSLCNGVDDCGDGSDEAFCPNCTAGLVACGSSGTCLPRGKLCDGRADCSDGWDETQELCGFSSATCAASEFQCGDGQCIHRAWMCDGSGDCSDGSDEENCDQNECEINNGGCSHRCEDQPMGFVCLCPEHMRLVGNSECEEVDVCLEKDACDQLCVHANGSLTCACREGYSMNAASGECKAKGDQAQLVFTSSEGLQWINITRTEHREPGRHLPGPGPVVALASNRTVYWAQQGQGSITRVSMDGKPQEPALVLKVQGSVSGLAVDWINRLLYWTSMESGSVHVGLLDRSEQRQLITGLEKPSGVAVHPLQGLLFWAQCGVFPKITRANLDGRGRMALVTSSVRHPVALSLDMPRQLLYWVDQGMRSISRVNLEGRDRKTVVESNGYLDRPFGLAVFEGFVYWSEAVTRSVCRANKHDGSQLQVLLTNVTSPGGVAVIHPVLQPNGPSVCGRPGSMCQHKCVVSLTSENPDFPEFTCVSPETGLNETREVPAVTHTVPASTLSDPAFAGILSLITFLCVLLVGVALWWWREEFKTSRFPIVQSFYLKESQDPLITQGPAETLHKLDLEG